MLPDKAAEILQIPERGMELLDRCENEPKVLKAIEMVTAGFEPADVARKYGLEYEAPEEAGPLENEGINVWECRTPRCRQKGRVATATNEPMCPQCGQPMSFLMNVEDAAQISHMARVTLGRPNIKDPNYRTDKTNVPDFALGDED